MLGPNNQDFWAGHPSQVFSGSIMIYYGVFAMVNITYFTNI